MNILLQPQNLVKLSRTVSHELGSVELTDDENALLIKLVKRINTNTLKQYSNDMIIATLAKIIAKKIRSESKEINRESLIVAKTNYENVYDITQLFGVSDKHTLLRVLNPSALYDYKFIILSTANSTTTADNPYVFNWQIMENDTLSTGMVNIKPIKNIIGIRLFPMKFIFAYSSLLRPNVAGVFITIQFANYALLIKELISQSILGYNNMRFHFLLTSTLTNYNTNYLELTAKKENGIYQFNPLITLLPSITLNIGDYLGQTGFPLSYIPVIIELINPILVWIPNSTISIVTGMICRFYNPVIYNPTTVINNTFILALTDGAGFSITTTTALDNYTRFTIPLDGTVINAADVPTTHVNTLTANPTTYVNVYIPSSANTIIPMCFISLKS